MKRPVAASSVQRDDLQSAPDTPGGAGFIAQAVGGETSLDGAKIVVVDDDKALARALERILRHLGCSVALFTSAQEALAYPGLKAADCLLLDLAMPTMSGLEFQEELLGRGIGIPVVFLSGQGDIPSTVRAMQNGAVDFLEKPVEASALKNAILVAKERSQKDARQKEQLEKARQRFECLTQRQREVFKGVVMGLPNKAIAHRMGITIRTVKAHRKALMEKLDAKSVADLAFFARDLKQ